MSLEPDQIENVKDGELPIPAINRIATYLRALLPTSVEKSSLSGGISDANALFATSTTPYPISTGSKTFTVEEGRTFLLTLPYVQVADRNDETRWMAGKVTSYVGDQLTVNVTEFNGTGNGANWIVGLAGRPGTGGTGSLATPSTPAPTISTGGTASASSEYNSGYLAAYAFDGNDSTRWAAVSGVAPTLNYTRSTGVTPTAVRLYPHLDGTGTMDAPTNFVIKARNGTGAYTTLLTVTGYTWSSTSPVVFPFANSTSYTDLQISMSAISGRAISLRQVDWLGAASAGTPGSVIGLDKRNLDATSNPTNGTGGYMSNTPDKWIAFTTSDGTTFYVPGYLVKPSGSGG